MSDSPIERENLTAALVREYDDEALVVWIHLLQDHGEAMEAEVERLRESLRGLLAGSAKDDPYVKAALDGLLTSLSERP